MPRKSEVDKIIEKNYGTFEKYEEYAEWKAKHFKHKNDRKYKEAWDKCYKLTDEDDDNE